MIVDLFLTGLLHSLVLVLITYAVMIPFRLLNFPDLTVEGAYPLGGAILSYLLTAGKLHPGLSVLSATLCAGLAGVCTGVIHIKLGVNTLLAGIILSTMIYSVDLRILGKPNIPLFNTPSLFNGIIFNIVVLTCILVFIVVLLRLFLQTELGLRLRAVGLNRDFAVKQGINVEKYIIFGLFAASCLGGLAGSLTVQLQRYMDIGMGVGIIMHALAAMMIGESLIGNDTINRQLLSAIVGALLYQQIRGVVLLCGLSSSDLKFFTGALIVAVIALKRQGIRKHG